MKITIAIFLNLFVFNIISGQTLESDFSSLSTYFHNNKVAERLSGSKTERVSIFPLALNVNTKEKQIDVRNSYMISLNSNNDDRNVDLDIQTGYSIGGKIDNSVTSIFKDNNVIGGFKGGGLISLRIQQSSKVFERDDDFLQIFREYDSAPSGSEEEKKLEKKLINHVADRLHNGTYWLYLSPTWEGRKFTNVDSLTSVDFQKRKNTLSSWTIGVSTYQNDLPLNFMGLFDLSLKFKKEDNFSSLEEISSFTQFSASGNSTSSTNRKSFTSYFGEYQDDINSKDFSIETYLVNKDLPLFGLYLNPIYNFDNDLYSATLNLNYTIYFLSSKKSVLSPNFGLVFSHQDLLKERDELFENDKSRFLIGLVTRLNVGDWFN